MADQIKINCKIEITDLDGRYFDPAFFDPAFFDTGAHWIDVVPDARLAEPITVEYGIRGNTPTDRVANSGTAKFALDNSQMNTGLTLGWYSILNRAKRSGFDLNLPVRISFSSPQVNAASGYSAVILADSPQGYWRMDELTGLTVVDYVASRNGTINGGVTLGQPSPIVGSTAMTFDGSTGYISVPHDAALSPTGAFSIEAWVKYAGTGYVPIVNHFGTSPTYNGFILSSGNIVAGKIAFWQGGGWTTGTTTADNQWHHIVAVWNGTEARIYVDGVLVITNAPAAAALTGVTHALEMGRSYDSSVYSSLTLDDVAFYNRALSAESVIAHFTARNATPIGQPYYKFLGTLDEIVPDPGVFEERMVHCTATDIWDDFGNINEPDIQLLQGKRFDEIATTILDAMTTQPRARSLETGSETYAFALDGGTGQQIKVRERFQQLALSEFGYFYSKGDTVGGGTLVGENRHHRILNQVPKFTIDNTMDIGGISVPTARRDIYRTVQLEIHPTNDLGTTTAIVLFSVQKTTTLLQPGETNSYIFGAYFDPVSHTEIGGYSPSPTYDPVATTDYTMNTLSDGTGTDQTANFTVTASRTGLGVRFTVHNTGTAAAYITKLQVRGIPIYRYDLTLQKTVPGSYGDQMLALSLPFQNSANVAADILESLIQRYSARMPTAGSVRFPANYSLAHAAAALQLEPGDRIGVLETLTGLSSSFTINGVQLELEENGLLWCTWFLEPASSQQYWLIGVAGSSELGSTTILGF